MNGRVLETERTERRNGFTLLELIAVIGIISILTAVTVGGYTGMKAAQAETSTEQTLERAFTLARQEACVEGKDVYVFVVDIDRFAIVRRAGVVTRVEPPAGTGKTKNKQAWGAAGGEITARWIIDDYADLADRQLTYEMSLDTKEEKDKFAEDYEGNLVFDMDPGKRVMARVVSPSRWVSDQDAWVFGIDDLPNASTASKFEIGDEYGWITHPVYALSDGWVFTDSYDESGAFNNKSIKVHFDSGGSVEDAPVTITVENPSKGRSFSIVVDNQGAQRE